jgi:AraC-like DNA-binding protein
VHWVLAFVAREPERQALRAALPPELPVRFVGRPDELRQPWRNEPPTAIVVTLQQGIDEALEHALEAVRRMAPRAPVWAFFTLHTGSMHEVLRLATRRLIDEALLSEEDLGARLKPLLRRAYALSETTAIRRVWRKWTVPETRDLIDACIDASIGAASVADIARAVNKSSRALERLVSRSSLPSTHRLVSMCRLLRAAHRLEQPESNVKMIATALGYSSPRALAKHLRRQTGFTIRELRFGGFARLTAFVHAELFTIRAGGEAPARTIARGRERREVGRR